MKEVPTAELILLRKLLETKGIAFEVPSCRHAAGLYERVLLELALRDNHGETGPNAAP